MWTLSTAELFFGGFVLGFMIGGSFGITFMCMFSLCKKGRL